MARDDEPDGVGGWLTVFLVSWGVVTPLGTLFFTYALLSRPGQATAFYGRWPAVQALEWLLAAMVCVACWGSCWSFLKRRNWNTVRLAIAALCFMVLQSMILTPLVMIILAPLHFAYLVAFIAWNPWHAPLYAAVCILYLLLSKRVARTYRPQSAAGIAEVFD